MRCYQNKRYNIKQRDEGTLDNRRRDGGTNFILRIKEKETRIILHEHDNDDDKVYNGFIWLGLGTSGGLLYKR